MKFSRCFGRCSKAALISVILVSVSLAWLWLLSVGDPWTAHELHRLTLDTRRHFDAAISSTTGFTSSSFDSGSSSDSGSPASIIFVTVLQDSQRHMPDLRRLLGSMHRFHDATSFLTLDNQKVVHELPWLWIYGINVTREHEEEIRLWKHCHFVDLYSRILPGSPGYLLDPFQVEWKLMKAHLASYVRLVLLEETVQQFGHAVYVDVHQKIHAKETILNIQSVLEQQGAIRVYAPGLNHTEHPILEGYVRDSALYQQEVVEPLACWRGQGDRCLDKGVTAVDEWATSATDLQDFPADKPIQSKYFCYIHLKYDFMYNRAVFQASLNDHLRSQDTQMGHVGPTTALRKIGIGVATKSNTKTVDQLTFLTSFIHTLSKTITVQETARFKFTVYVGYDHGDPVIDHRQRFTELQHHLVTMLPPHLNHSSALEFRWIRMPASNGWLTAIWNTLYIESMLTGLDDYFIQVNDDLKFLTTNWASTLTDILHQRAKDVGVVGPNDIKWNCTLLTQAMVSRKHYEIFGWLYPPQIKDWYSDFWLTKVYGPEKTFCDFDVKVKNLQNQGSRYALCNQPKWSTALNAGKRQIHRWLKKYHARLR